jgi:RNA polymerase sigma factor (sigma-70 family)
MATTTPTTRRSTATSPESRHVTPEGRAAFVTTHWTAVVAAGRADASDARAALEHLCQTYWHPIYAYIRRSGQPPEDAKDLTQAFFARLLERNLIARADRDRGRFRSFLLASLKHFLAHEWEKSRTLKRGGAVRFEPLQFDTAEIRFTQPAAAMVDTPDRAFDRQWALALLDTVLARLQSEYADAGRARLFEGLKETLSGGRAEIPYRDLAARLAVSEGAVKVAAHRLRKRYRELLREEIAGTVADAQDVEAELRELFAALN